MCQLKIIAILIVILSTFLIITTSSKNSNVINSSINDLKEFKKLLRTKTNILVMFIQSSNSKEIQNQLKIFKDSAEIVKGFGTMVLIECSVTNDKKKLCKKLKVNPNPYFFKHYKDGDFHKDYDRQLQVTSIVNFMRDPSGDLPWEEDPNGSNVVHIPEINQLTKLLKKDTKPTLVMFYAPWCGFCKQLKPEYNEIATELKGKFVIAAIDVDRPENSIGRKQYNITGFPTLLYFENGKMKHVYEGDNKKAAIIEFMKNPTIKSIKKQKDEDWSIDSNSEVVHLTSNGFEPALKDEHSVLVMFHANWCGHCKRMKPEYEKAAQQMKSLQIPGILAALDAPKEADIAQKYNVKGYPTLKYFVNAEYKFDVNFREADKIIEFMKDPKEPPPPPPPEKPWEDEVSEVQHLNEENFKLFLKKKKYAIVMFHVSWCGHCKKTKPEFTAAAEEFKDDTRVAFCAVDCTLHSSLCANYNIRSYPTLKYFSYLKTSFDYTGGRLKKDFVEFIKNPETKDKDSHGNLVGEDKILILNDSNFEPESKKIKRMLVLFYTTWCGHCKAMKPNFFEAASKIQYNSIRLATVDCDINKVVVNTHKIDTYPTIMLFEYGKYVSEYNGPRETNDLFNFVMSGYNEKDEL